MTGAAALDSASIAPVTIRKGRFGVAFLVWGAMTPWAVGAVKLVAMTGAAARGDAIFLNPMLCKLLVCMLQQRPRSDM